MLKIRKRHIYLAALFAVSAIVMAPAVARGAPVSIDDLTLYAGNKVDLQKDVTVLGDIGAGAGGFKADKNASLNSVYTLGEAKFQKDSNIIGEVWAEGKITFARNTSLTGNVLSHASIDLGEASYFDGDVRPGLGHSLSIPDDTTVTGLTTPATSDVELWGGVNLPANPGGSYGSDNLHFGQGSADAIDPGSYRDLDVSKNSSLTFTAGTYDFRKITIDKDTQLSFDTSGGAIVLNVHKGLSTGKNVIFSRLGDGSNLQINVIDDDIKLGQDNQMDALVTVFSGDFRTGNDSTLTGAFYAGHDIRLGEGTSVSGMSVGGGSSRVPEPATLILLGLGGLAMGCNYRRQRHRAAA